MTKNESDLLEAFMKAKAPSVKVDTYFRVYADVFGAYRNTKCTFIEFGVLDGGSLFMWRDWLGPDARIIGVDLNPGASQWRDYGFDIRIGDQGDPEFLDALFQDVGDFDMVLDDGGHRASQQIATTLAALRHSKGRSVIAVEDTVTSFLPEFGESRTSFLEFAKACSDHLTARNFHLVSTRVGRVFPCREVMDKVFDIRFSTGIVVFNVDDRAAEAPQLVRNMPPKGASDFRYNGRESVDVVWPNIHEPPQVYSVR